LASLAADGLEDRVVPQAGVVVGVGVTGQEPEQPLADDRRQNVLDLAALAVVVENLGDGGRPPEAMVQLADGQQSGVGADEPAVKIRDDGFTPKEVEGKLCWTGCHTKASLPHGLRIVAHPHSTRLRRPLLCAELQNS